MSEQIIERLGRNLQDNLEFLSEDSQRVINENAVGFLANFIHTLTTTPIKVAQFTKQDMDRLALIITGLSVLSDKGNRKALQMDTPKTLSPILNMTSVDGKLLAILRQVAKRAQSKHDQVSKMLTGYQQLSPEQQQKVLEQLKLLQQAYQKIGAEMKQGTQQPQQNKTPQ